MHTSTLRGGTIYTANARFDGTARAYTEDELRRLAPSVFATTPHESRSERFQPIPTYEIVKALAKEGFSVVGVKQSKTRVEGKADFTKHLLRIRRLDDQKLQVGDSVFEMMLKNANDGTGAYDLLGAIWKILCGNSLVTKTATLDEVKVRHTGTPEGVMSKVVEGTYRVLQESERILAAPQDWSVINLTSGAREAFAKAAHTLRFDDEPIDIEGREIAPVIEPKQLLIPRRFEDGGKDLWTTFNVIQENAIKGGLQGHRYSEALGKDRRVTTRPIKGIDQDVKLNRALWVLAEELKKAVA